MQIIRSAQLREKVGESKNCEVYAFGKTQVVKLYRRGFDPDEIELQAGIAAIVQRSGLPMPQIQPGLVKNAEDGRLGVVYERASGPTLAQALKRQPLRLFNCARILAGQHRLILDSPSIEGLRAQKPWLREKIDEEPAFDDAQRAALGRLLDALPDGDRICHGDFGVDNVILGAERPMLIDWANATRGSGLCDIARSWTMLRFNQFLSKPLRLYCAVLAALYVRYALRGHRYDSGEFERWRLVNAAVRLHDLRADAERAPVLAYLRPRLARLVAGAAP